MGIAMICKKDRCDHTLLLRSSANDFEANFTKLPQLGTPIDPLCQSSQAHQQGCKGFVYQRTFIVNVQVRYFIFIKSKNVRLHYFYSLADSEHLNRIT